MMSLNWPHEWVSGPGQDSRCWQQPGSNICLDFHGNPCGAQLVVFSDGNHHMALQQALRLFQRQTGVTQLFYATAPPGLLVQMLAAGGLWLGNLYIQAKPHVMLSPPQVLAGLLGQNPAQSTQPFMRNQGSVLLLRKGNPKGVVGLSDLQREDIRLFISSPDTEGVSYRGYHDTLKALAAKHKLTLPQLETPQPRNLVYGESIHHREAPQALAEDRADVALVYYHLALRYSRIFPEWFEILPLGGSVAAPRPEPENVISQIHLAQIGDGGPWGKMLVDFLLGREVSEIYQYHGLLPTRA